MDSARAGPDVSGLLGGVLPEEDAEELYDRAPCGYLTTGPDGTILRVNQTFMEWTGHGWSDLMGGRRLQDLLTPAGRIFWEMQVAPLLRMQGFVNEIAFDIACPNGAGLPVLLNVTQKRNVDGAPVMNRVTVFNATDRRRYERELLEARRRAEEAALELRRLNETLEARVAHEVTERLRAEEQLRQAQRMHALGRIAGGIAHDFNNMLTVVQGGLDILGRGLAGMPAETPQLQRLTRAQEMAIEGVRRAAGLTRRLLAFARRQPLDARALDVNALLAGLTELLRRAAGDAVAVEIQPAEALWRVRADANGLDNALLNLVVNARDAMPEGGRVLIETANAVLDAEEAARFPEPVPPGDYVRISVTDTGTGMDAATLARVFEPFFTTKEPGKGTGLGLAQIHGFVRQSGGQVSIESRLGEGTRVCLFLPRLRPEDEASEAAEQQAEAPAGLTEAGRGETLLLVEDDEALRLFATETLTELGYQVLAAANGAAALQLLEERPEIKLLFTDVLLPGGMDGRHLAGLAREQWPELRLLLTTGHGGVVEARDSPIGPGIWLLRKPYSRADLAAALRRLLDDGG